MSVGVETHRNIERPRSPAPGPRTPLPVLISDASVGVAAGAVGDEINLRRVHQALRGAGFKVGFAEPSIEQLIEVCAGDPPDALIAAGSHEALASASRLRELRMRVPSIPMVVVVPSTDNRSLRKTIAAGVEGCVRESDIERVLGLTVAAVLVGQLCVPTTMRHLVTKPAFSHREKQVLELVARGLTNNEIAEQLFLAESTIKSHLSSGFRKLGVNSRQEAAAIVLDPENGFTPQLVTAAQADVGDGAGAAVTG